MSKGGGDRKKKDMVIDLFADDSDDDDADLFKETTPIFAAKSKRKSPDSVADAESFFGNKKPAAVNSAAAQNQHLKYLGHFLTNVLGAQHFPAPSAAGDNVTLVPEPTNMFDPNAVKVVAGTGAKLGTLPREHAAVICPMLKTLSHKVAFSATILSTSSDRRKVQIVVDVHAKSFRELTPAEIQQTTDYVMPMLQKVAWKSGHVRVSTDQILKETQASTDQVLNELARDVAQGNVLPQSPSGLGEPFEDYVPADIDSSLMADWESQQQELDKIFEEIQNKQLENLPDIPMPKQLEKVGLYEYQKNGIKWLYNQETSDALPSWFVKRDNGKWFCTVTGYQQLKNPRPVRGAILADDMGLGKTLQILGLLLSNPPEGQKGYPYKERSISSGNTAPRCTLIVCPVTVTSNWVLQIRKHVNGGVENKVLKVAVYHGPNRERNIPLVQYNKIDVLITSYHTLASDLKKLKQEEEGSADPSVFKKKVQKKRKVAGKQLSIFDVLFHRVVLDEAHIIRSGTKTGLYNAAKAVQSKYRVGLTGTPFVNRPADMHSLLAFLQVEPLSNKPAFDRCITRRIEVRDERGLATLRNAMAHLALRRNKVQVHSTIKLVEKTVTQVVVPFPEGTHKDIHDMLFFTAKAAFIGFLKNNDYEGIVDNYMTFLTLVLRVRQSCASGALVPDENRENAQAVYEMLTKSNESNTDWIDPEVAQQLLDKLQGIMEDDSGSTECAVCLEILEEENVMILKGCKHVFCSPCLEKITSHICPCCRAPYGPEDMVSKKAAEAMAKSDEEKDDRKELKHAKRIVKDAMKMGRSPKTQALLDEIDRMAPDEKGVIFSQWTSHLDILEGEFQKEGFTYTRIDGKMSMNHRIDAMDEFDTEQCNSMRTPRFILCSLHACGTGINLTRGNVVFLMDPWWNSAVEQQALDRCHRIGQKRPVRVYRFLMEDSMETRMMAIQESKEALGKGSLERLSPEQKRKARITKLHDLFMVKNVEELWEEE